MEIRKLSDVMLLKNKEDVLRLFMYGKLLESGIRPYENDINILLELYNTGGYNNSSEQLSFINLCIKKKMKRTDQSVRNTLSKYTKLKILEKPKNSMLKISDAFLPKVECDKLVLNPLISHRN